jgi:hypothetical protein
MPVTEDVTDTLNVQVAPAARLVPESPTVVPPAFAAVAPPVQVVDALGSVAIVTFAGRLSVRPIDERATAVAAVLAIVTVSVDVPFTAIAAGEKLFASVIPETLPTLSAAVAGVPFVAPCVVVTVLAGIVFVQMPLVELLTDTVIIQVAFAATVPLESATVEPAATAATVPAPQVVEAFGVAAIVTLAGSESLSASAERGAEPAAVFATVIVSVDVPPSAIVAGLKAFDDVTFGAEVSVLVPVDGVWFAYPPIAS